MKSTTKDQTEGVFHQMKGRRRRNTMKSSTKDQREGIFHQMKGNVKEIAKTASLNPELEVEGKKKKRDGKVQEKVGQIKKVVDK